MRGSKAAWIALGVLLMLLVAPRSMHAADYTIVIHHMELEEITQTFKVGDVVTFENQSDIAHNLYITYADGSVDNLDTQTPGMKRKVTLRVPGPAKVKCWIHPIINLDFTIAPQDDAAQ